MNKNIKLVEEKFQKLDDISHCLLRPGRYLGSVSPHTASTFIFSEVEHKMVQEEITWCPALIKVFDEVISNSVDFSTTEDGKHLDTIKVEIDKETGEISIYDNGGIVVVKHKEHDQWIPELIFELKAGSNFSDDDDSVTTGQNGEGAALTSIFSTEFQVKTADGANQFDQTHFENSRRKTEPKIKKSEKRFTQITWTPDYPKFNLESLDSGNYSKIVKRVYDVAGCNPNLKVYLNGHQIKIKSFEDYINLYLDEYAFDENENWKIGLAKSEEGFKHISFVNGTETSTGGTHINYITDQIIYKLREYFKKKHKVEVKPSDIKNQLFLFVNATIIKPRYSSQTKEDLITEPKSYQTSWECSDKFIKKLINSEIIQSVLDWVNAKQQAELMAQLRKHNKNVDRADPKQVPKFHDATTKNRNEAILLLAEGDSASTGILSGRNPKLHAVFPLRGKPINVFEMDLKEVIENKEFKNILTITGLQLGTKVERLPTTDRWFNVTIDKKQYLVNEIDTHIIVDNITYDLGVLTKALTNRPTKEQLDFHNELIQSNLIIRKTNIRFGKIGLATDSDVDGFHIRGLLMNMLYKFWPELYDLGIISIFETPAVKVEYKKQKLSFHAESEFRKWQQDHMGEKYTSKYYKGLGTASSKEWKEYFEKESFQSALKQIIITEEEKDLFTLLFSKAKGMTDRRKEWLAIAEDQGTL